MMKMSQDDSKQLFILGAPRSGTTFLASLLTDTHYGIPFETHFITKYFKQLSKFGELDKKENFKRLLNAILAERAVMQWKLSLDLDEFYEYLDGDYSYANIAHQLCLLGMKKTKEQAWGDKTPHYVGDIDAIYQLFPKAKYIYIVRDGRDVTLSLLKKNWGPNNVYACAHYWKDLNANQQLLKQLEEQKQLFFLRYEDLLASPIQTSEKIYQFLNQSYDLKSLEQLCSTTKSDNHMKWKQQLSDRQIKLFDQVAASTLNNFGYPTFYTEGNIGYLSKTYYKLHNKLLHYKFLFEANIIDGIKIKFFNKEPFAE